MERALAQRRLSAFATLALAALMGCHARRPVVEETPTLRLGAIGRVLTLDPARADDPVSIEEASRVYEPLLEYHYLRRPFARVGALAEAPPSPVGRGPLHTLAIRKGVLFQDDRCFQESGGRGRELTAADAVFTLRRIADPAIASPLWSRISGTLPGLDAWRETAVLAGAADYARPIDGLRARDRYTVELKVAPGRLERLGDALASPQAAVVAAEAVRAYGNELGNHPVGTGPFRLVQLNPSARLVWERNPTYRHAVYPTDGEAADGERGLLVDAGKTLPLVSRVTVDVFGDARPAWEALRAGRLDLGIIPNHEGDSGLAELGLTEHVVQMPDTAFLAVNMSDPVLGKSRVLRQALQAAQRGAGVPGGLAAAEGTPAFELLTAADDPAGQAVAELVRARTQAFGLRLKIHSCTPAELENERSARRAALWVGRWAVAAGPAAAEVAARLQFPYGTEPSPVPLPAGAEVDPSPFDAAAFFGSLAQSLARGGVDHPEAVALSRRIARLTAEDAFGLFGFDRTERLAVRTRVRNFKLFAPAQGHALDQGFGLAKYYRVEPLGRMQ